MSAAAADRKASGLSVGDLVQFRGDCGHYRGPILEVMGRSGRGHSWYLVAVEHFSFGRDREWIENTGSLRRAIVYEFNGLCLLVRGAT